jgi:small subunit ribosomal protein S20
MPVTQSARKALRRDRRRHQINLRIRRRVKEAIKKTRRQPTTKNLREAFRYIDRAAKKHIFHRNRAARLKSNLSKLVKNPKKSK